MSCSLSYSNRSYLNLIYQLSKKQGYVRPIDISNGLHVTKPSVTRAIKNLEAEEMIEKNNSGEIVLTSTGIAAAKSFKDRCEILRKLFRRIAEDSYELPESEASKMAYLCSEETILAMMEFIQEEELCPFESAL